MKILSLGSRLRGLVLLSALSANLGHADPLPAEQAFPAQLVSVPGGVEVRFRISEGYYLYRDRIQLQADSALPKAEFPEAEIKNDPNFGPTPVYHHQLSIRLPLSQAWPAQAVLQVKSQGCSEQDGICYPPFTQNLRLNDNAAPPSAKPSLMGMLLGDNNPPAAKPAAPTPNKKITSAHPAPVATSPNANPAAQTVAPAPAEPPAAPEALAPAALPPTPPAEVMQPPAAPAPAPSIAVTPSPQPTTAAPATPNHIWLLLGFFVAGLGMALTACMYPLIPIVVALVSGSQQHPRRRVLLCLLYIQGMAATYTVAGIAAGLSGRWLNVALQSPTLTWAMGGMFALLGLGMHGVLSMQLPGRWQTALGERANRLPGGQAVAVLVMGALSALMIGPCVTPPLMSALLLIGQQGQPGLGALALFVMAQGLGLPLLLVGALGSRFLPQAGPWMNHVRTLLAAMMFAVAVDWVSPLVAPPVRLALWGGWCLSAAMFLHALEPLPANAKPGRILAKTLGWLALIWGALLLVGAASGREHPLQPLAAAQVGPNDLSPSSASAQPTWIRVLTLNELQQRLAQAQQQRQAVVVDVYADWCRECHHLEQQTLRQPAVIAALQPRLQLRWDITAMHAEQQSWMQSQGLIGPPALLFFDGQGHMQAKLIGFQSPEALLQTLQGLRP